MLQSMALAQMASIFIDNDPDSINSLLTSPVGELVNYDQYVFGQESATFKNKADRLSKEESNMGISMMDIMRREAEQCDLINDIIIQTSQMGGTGSGTGNYFSERCSIEYWKKFKLQVKVVPPPSMLGNEVLTLYNNILGLNIEHAEANLWFDNDCLYRIYAE